METTMNTQELDLIEPMTLYVDVDPTPIDPPADLWHDFAPDSAMKSSYSFAEGSPLSSPAAPCDVVEYDSDGKLIHVYGPFVEGYFTPDYHRYQIEGQAPAEAELNFNKARCYDPTTGRWLSGDPLPLRARRQQPVPVLSSRMTIQGVLQ